MCLIHEFDDWDLEKEMVSQRRNRREKVALVVEEEEKNTINDVDDEGPTSNRRSKRKQRDSTFSYRRHFRTSYIIRASSNAFLFPLASSCF